MLSKWLRRTGDECTEGSAYEGVHATCVRERACARESVQPAQPPRANHHPPTVDAAAPARESKQPATPQAGPRRVSARVLYACSAAHVGSEELRTVRSKSKMAGVRMMVVSTATLWRYLSPGTPQTLLPLVM